jgi:predicted dehydrogenase
MINVGIIGLGFMGRTHFAVYEKSKHARVTAMMDLDAKRRAGDWSDTIGNVGGGLPKKVDMKNRIGYGSIDEIIHDPEVDLIDITLPTNFHADVAVQALQAGKHVLCEKPMALSKKDCMRIVNQAKKSKGMFMAAQCIRFWPQYVKIHELVQSGKFGKPKSAKLRRLASAPDYSKGGWLMNSKLSGGAIFDLHIHDIDFASYLFGKPKRVVAQGTRGPSGGVDHVEALWDYGKDLLVSIEGGWCFHGEWPFQMYVNVRCEDATFIWDMNAEEAITVYRPKGKTQKIKVKPSTGWDEEIFYFLDCIRKKKKPTIVTPMSSTTSVELAEAELKSVRTGRPVALGK